MSLFKVIIVFYLGIYFISCGHFCSQGQICSLCNSCELRVFGSLHECKIF